MVQQDTSGGGPTTDRPSRRAPADVEQHLEGVNYPASRDDLEQAARNNHAPEEVLQEIRSLPGRDYERKEDVSRAFIER